MTSDRFQQLRLIEAVLFASAEPLTRDQLRRHLPEEAEVDDLITELMQLYANRGVALVQAGGRFAFRTAPDLASQMKIESTVNRKLSRAAIETLAIISYHQPITRAEIEEVRGVTQSKGTLDTLLEAGWIKPKGRRKTPGRPVTWGTTDAFLDHFGLESLDALPGIEELKAAGLIDARPAIAALGARGDLGAAETDGEGDEDEISVEEALAEDFGENLVEPPLGGEAAELEDALDRPAELTRRRRSDSRASGG
ncbi:MAG: SMC-Scp complex subunit ScpB [Kiloniellales bacterium]